MSVAIILLGRFATVTDRRYSPFTASIFTSAFSLQPSAFVYKTQPRYLGSYKFQDHFATVTDRRYSPFTFSIFTSAFSL